MTAAANQAGLSSCSYEIREVSSGERETSHPPTMGCWVHFLLRQCGWGWEGVVPTLRTKWSFWFPVSTFYISDLYFSIPAFRGEDRYESPCVEGEEIGQRGRQFSLNHTVNQGKKVECQGTTISPPNCPASFKAQLNVNLLLISLDYLSPDKLFPLHFESMFCGVP